MELRWSGRPRQPVVPMAVPDDEPRLPANIMLGGDRMKHEGLTIDAGGRP